MRAFGLPIPFTASWRAEKEKALRTLPSRNNTFFGWLHETFAGAWQQNVEVEYHSVLRFPAVYACVTLIAGDIAKLRLRLMERKENGIWEEVIDPVNPVFYKPNDYQTRVQFIEQWVLALLLHGNAYVWMERNSAEQVIALHVLDPNRVTVLVSESGMIFYQLGDDMLAGLGTENVTVPASEMIHDRYKPLHHPLVGVSPLSAAGLAATLGGEILANSAKFFKNGSRPSGILSAPGLINEATAKRLKEYWDSEFGGQNSGRTAVLGDGLKYEAMTMKAIDAQLLDQLKLTNEMVAMVLHVPAYKIGAGQIPTYQNAAVLNQIYYADCIQTIIENMEAALDLGLGLGRKLGAEFDTSDLLRMDEKTQVDTLSEAVKGGIMPPNVALRRQNLPPIPGGDTVYLQQQQYSLEALSKRDAKDDPFAKTEPSAQPNPAADNDDDQERAMIDASRRIFKGLADV